MEFFFLMQLCVLQQGQNQHNQYLGDPSVALPPFPEIEFDPSDTLPGDLTLEDVEAFRALYEEHCEVSHSLLFFSNSPLHKLFQ